MHEMSIALQIIEIVLAETGRLGTLPVTEIGIRVGDLSGVDPEALAFTFGIAAWGTQLADAVLSIERVPIRAQCKSCGHSFIINDSKFFCPSCTQQDLTVREGEELEVTYITERDA